MSPGSVVGVLVIAGACLVSAVVGLPLVPVASGDAVIPCFQNATSDLNQCIARSLEHFLQAAKNGLPDIGLESVDPLLVKHMHLDKGAGKERVSLDFREVRIAGFSGSTVHSVRMNVNDKKMEVSLRAPVYEIDGFYECVGGVYELPLSSSGRFSVTLTDVTSAWMLYFVTQTINGERSVGVNRFIVDISPANVVYRFDKKFDGENSLGIGEAMDEFMNENALEIFNDIKPNLMKILGDLFLERANQVLMNYPRALDIADK